MYQKNREARTPEEHEEFLKYRRNYQGRYRKNRKAKDPEAHRKRAQRNKWSQRYGITPEQYEERLRAQNGVCAVCYRSETMEHNGRIRPLVVDHDHNTNKVRQLLCQRCNLLVAQLENNQLLIEAALNYLKKHE